MDILESIKKAYFVCFESNSNKEQIQSKVIENFPSVMQANNWVCGPAVMQCLLNYYGIVVFQEDLLKELDTNESHGTDILEMVKFFKKRNFDVSFGEMNIEMLKSLVDNDTPVILEIQAWSDNPASYDTSDNDSHFIVVIGYNDDGFICEDPYISNKGFISYEDLNRRWHSRSSARGERLNNIGLAIVGKKPKFIDSKIVEIK